MGGKPSLILDGAGSSSTLWLGGMDVLEEVDFFKKNEITHVLSACQDIPVKEVLALGIHNLHIEIDDVETAQLAPHFEAVARWVHAARVAGGNVYIHCAAGISRSTTCLCAYLMVNHGLAFSACLRFVKGRRGAVCPNAGFRRQLAAFESSAGGAAPRARAFGDELRAAFGEAGAKLVAADLALINGELAEYDATHFFVGNRVVCLRKGNAVGVITVGEKSGWFTVKTADGTKFKAQKSGLCHEHLFGAGSAAGGGGAGAAAEADALGEAQADRLRAELASNPALQARVNADPNLGLRWLAGGGDGGDVELYDPVAAAAAAAAGGGPSGGAASSDDDERGNPDCF